VDKHRYFSTFYVKANMVKRPYFAKVMVVLSTFLIWERIIAIS